MAYLPTRRTARFFASILAGSAAFILLASPIPSQAAQPDSWPAKVSARYAITFNGFNIGSFDFDAKVRGREYVLTGDARVSALLGVIKWRGLTRSAGVISGPAPKPAAYTFDYRSRQLGGAIKMSFKRGNIAQVSAVPPSPARDQVPLKAEHLRGVIDPLTAVMALSKPTGSDPCARRIPVFDGKQRFDLTFTYAGKTRLSGQRRGETQVGYVCKVSYRPIAGYTPSAAVRHMAGRNALQVILRPVAGARLLVPHQISVSTLAGYAKLTLERINVVTPQSDRIALAR